MGTIETANLGALYDEMMRADNPMQWLLDRYGNKVKDILACNLPRDDPLCEIVVKSAVQNPDPRTAAKIFSQITGYKPQDTRSMSGSASADTAALQEQFSRMHRDLMSDIMRLRAYDLWDDLTKDERAESLLYIRVKIKELREMQKRLQSPENDELILLLEGDLNVIARRDMATPPKNPAPAAEAIVGVLSSLNELQLKGIMKMYAIPACGDCKEWQSIVRFLSDAESPIRRYAIREHVRRILEIRKNAKLP